MSLSRNLNQNQISLFSKKIELSNVQMFSDQTKASFHLSLSFSLGSPANLWTRNSRAHLFWQSPLRNVLPFLRSQFHFTTLSQYYLFLMQAPHGFIHSFDHDLSRAPAMCGRQVWTKAATPADAHQPLSFLPAPGPPSSTETQPQSDRPTKELAGTGTETRWQVVELKIAPDPQLLYNRFSHTLPRFVTENLPGRPFSAPFYRQKWKHETGQNLSQATACQIEAW